MIATQFPSFIEDEVFVTKEFNTCGKYTVRLYDILERGFVDVTVDSLIPCKPRHWWEPKCAPLFAQPKVRVSIMSLNVILSDLRYS